MCKSNNSTEKDKRGFEPWSARNTQEKPLFLAYKGTPRICSFGTKEPKALCLVDQGTRKGLKAKEAFMTPKEQGKIQGRRHSIRDKRGPPKSSMRGIKSDHGLCPQNQIRLWNIPQMGASPHGTK
jgi:hypothetical protein